MSQTLHNATDKQGVASGRILIEGEEPAEFESSIADLEAGSRPAKETEALLVLGEIVFHWLAHRSIRLQAVAFAASAFGEIPTTKFVSQTPQAND